MNKKSDNYFSQVLEIQKARQALGVFFALAMITLTGYAIQKSKSELFLLAALIPILALFLDSLYKYRFIVPFLYQALILEQGNKDEPISFLYLGYSKLGFLEYLKILELPAGIDRQEKFRNKYVFHKFWLKMSFFLIGTVGEIALWRFFR